MSKIRVAVLRGGPSSLYDVSLKTGASVLKHLPDRYYPQDIFIAKDGTWHRDGMPRNPERALAGIDVVFNALHGEYGEDGKVQKILDGLGLPYTGSGALASAIGMNKVLSKKTFAMHGLKTPYFTIIKNTDDLQEKYHYLFHHFFVPFVVKPATAGSSVGVTIVKDFRQVFEALEKAFTYSDTALIEEYIKGKEATCGVLEQFRDQPHYKMLPVEIIPTNHFFDYEAKYSGASKQRCPGNFTQAESLELQRMAEMAHKALGLRHYSRSDFIVTPRRGIYILEVNTLPGLATESLLPKSLEAVGVNYPEFLQHVIELALSGV